MKREDPLLLRVEEAARLLDISRARIFQLIGDGSIRSIKTGRSRRIPRAELDRWIQQQLDDQELFGGSSR